MRSSARVALAVAAATALLPSAAAAAAGRPVVLEGRLIAVHADLAHSEHSRFYLRTKGRYLRLRFAHPPAIRPRSRVRVRGDRVGRTLEVTRASVTAPAPEVATDGSRRLLAILTRWDGATPRATQSAATSVLFGADERSTDRWYRAVSYGQLGWTGDVTPPLTVPAPTYCDLYGMAENAKAAARAAGYEPDTYDNVMIVSPQTFCAGDGYGEVGGRQSWIFRGIESLTNGAQRYVLEHELGHNLGRWHSHGLECGTETITPECLRSSSSNVEYGNIFDVMGNPYIGWSSGAVAGFSAKPLLELGWLTGRFESITESGNYDIAPLEVQDPTSPQAIVISTATHRYYVDFRRPIGVDWYLGAFPDMLGGVHVNMTDDLPFGDNGPLLLDTTPASTAEDFGDAALAPGDVFYEVTGDFRLTVDAVGDDGARIHVEFGDFAPPETTITGGPDGVHGSTTANFLFDADEGSVTFECRMDAGAWTPCSSPAWYTGLAEGTHVFAVTATDAAGHVDQTPATRTFLVDVTRPRVTLTAPAANATVRGSVTLAATATDALTDIGRVKWFLDGVQIASYGGGPPWEKVWNSAGVANGVHKLVAKARDEAHNWGASRSILITVAN